METVMSVARNLYTRVLCMLPMLGDEGDIQRPNFSSVGPGFLPEIIAASVRLIREWGSSSHYFLAVLSVA